MKNPYQQGVVPHIDDTLAEKSGVDIYPHQTD